MPDVPDHMVPRDGLTNATIRLAGLDAIPGSNGAVFRFDLYDEQKRLVGTFPIAVPVQAQSGLDPMMKVAYAEMRDVFLQWAYIMNSVGDDQQ